MNPDKELILNYVEANSPTTHDEIMEDLDLSEDEAGPAIRELVEENRVGVSTDWMLVGRG